MPPKKEYHSEYRIWVDMRRRCHDPKNKGFKNYGAKGIEVCFEWRYGDGERTGFEVFYDDMGKRPRDKSLDRIENEKGYSPENCRWATSSQQARNRNNNKLNADGAKRVISLFESGMNKQDIADTMNVSRTLVRKIINREVWREVQ